MNTFGHKFFKDVNNCSDESDAIEIANESGYYICKICNLTVWAYKNLPGHLDSIFLTKMTGKLNITCNEIIIKKLLE